MPKQRPAAASKGGTAVVLFLLKLLFPSLEDLEVCPTQNDQHLGWEIGGTTI